MDSAQVPVAAAGSSVAAYGQGKNYGNYGFVGGLRSSLSNLGSRGVAVSMSAEASADDGGKALTQEEINK